MTLDLTGREGTDIGPLIRNAWDYGETIELPPGTYHSSPQVFPALRPWNEARCAIVGSGYQGTEIHPLPGYPWQPDQPMWQFACGRARVANLMFADFATSLQRDYVKFGDGVDIYEDCRIEFCDVRQYKRGIHGEMIAEIAVVDCNFIGGPGQTFAHFQDCNGAHIRNTWGQGGRGGFWQATRGIPGLNEGYSWVGRGCAGMETAIEVAGGDCFQFGDGGTCFDCLIGGVGILLRGSPEHPTSGGTVSAWIGGDGTKLILQGAGVANVKVVGSTLIGSRTPGAGRQDGIVLDGIAKPGGAWIWENGAAITQFRDLGCAVVEKNGPMPFRVDNSCWFVGCDHERVSG